MSRHREQSELARLELACRGFVPSQAPATQNVASNRERTDQESSGATRANFVAERFRIGALGSTVEPVQLIFESSGESGIIVHSGGRVMGGKAAVERFAS